MDANVSLGLQVNWYYCWMLIFGVMMALAIVQKLLDFDVKSFGFWIANLLISAALVGLIVALIAGYTSDKYEYVGLYSDTEIKNISSSGITETRLYIVQYSNPDGSIEDIRSDQILCVNGSSRIVKYTVKGSNFLYNDTKLKEVLVLNYDDYIKVVGNMNRLLQSKYIINVINDANLLVLGLNIEKDTDIDNDVKDKTSSEVESLRGVIKEKDSLIQKYVNENELLKNDLESLNNTIEDNNKAIEKLKSEKEKLKNANKVEFKSTDFINICIGIGILVLVGMGVFLMIVYTKHKLKKIEMTLKSELKIREGVMLDKELN